MITDSNRSNNKIENTQNTNQNWGKFNIYFTILIENIIVKYLTSGFF